MNQWAALFNHERAMAFYIRGLLTYLCRCFRRSITIVRLRFQVVFARHSFVRDGPYLCDRDHVAVGADHTFDHFRVDCNGIGVYRGEICRRYSKILQLVRWVGIHHLRIVTVPECVQVVFRL